MRERERERERQGEGEDGANKQILIKKGKFEKSWEVKSLPAATCTLI